VAMTAVVAVVAFLILMAVTAVMEVMEMNVTNVRVRGGIVLPLNKPRPSWWGFLCPANVRYWPKADTRGCILGPKIGCPAFVGLLSDRFRPKADTRIPSANPFNEVALTAATTLLQTELVSLCKRRYQSR